MYVTRRHINLLLGSWLTTSLLAGGAALAFAEQPPWSKPKICSIELYRQIQEELDKVFDVIEQTKKMKVPESERNQAKDYVFVESKRLLANRFQITD